MIYNDVIYNDVIYFYILRYIKFKYSYVKKEDNWEGKMESHFSPMSETAYYILLSLTKERHGYGIMQHVQEITNGRISLGAGTIYGTLGKLEKADLIVMSKEEEKRKYYKISAKGVEVLEKELLRIEELYRNGKEVMSNGNE